MKLEWTKEALESFRHIRSSHFTSIETKEYKILLLKNIKEKINLLGTSLPAEKKGWKSSYKVIIDQFIVYYSFSEDRKTCYIEYFKSVSQHR